MEEDEPDEDELGEVLLESEREALLREELAQVKAALELSAKEHERRELRAAEEQSMAAWRGYQAAQRKGGGGKESWGKGGDWGKGKKW